MRIEVLPNAAGTARAPGWTYVSDLAFNPLTRTIHNAAAAAAASAASGSSGAEGGIRKRKSRHQPRLQLGAASAGGSGDVPGSGLQADATAAAAGADFWAEGNGTAGGVAIGGELVEIAPVEQLTMKQKAAINRRLAELEKDSSRDVHIALPPFSTKRSKFVS